MSTVAVNKLWTPSLPAYNNHDELVNLDYGATFMPTQLILLLLQRF